MSNWDDCDDSDPTVYQGAPDTWYDGVDSDCAGDEDCDADLDGETLWLCGGDDCDDDDPSVVGYTWYLDGDGDGYGEEGTAIDVCVAPATGVLQAGDRDDDEDSTHPGTSEVCDNSQDDDCDGAAPLCGVGGQIDLADAAGTWTGAEDDLAGTAVATAGDVDVDGYDDLLVGAPGNLDGGAGAGAGTGLAFAGNADADGFVDLLVGAPGALGEHGPEGAAYLVSWGAGF